MSLVLLVLGILLTGAGGVAVGFGIPINDLSLGNTLILAGTTAAAAGLLLIGLSVAVGELAKIAEGLRSRPVARPPQVAEPIPQPQPAPVVAASAPRFQEPRPLPETPAIDVSASAIERLRSSIPRPDRVVPEAEGVPLSPNGGHAPVRAEPPAAPRVRPEERTAVETLREPQLDFLVRPRPARTSQPVAFDAVWPKRSTREPPAPTDTEEQPVAAAPVGVDTMPETPVPEPAVVPPAEAVQAVAVLKSGVVDGMAYTLYADGSIEAQLPQGTVRFGSIAELRTHIESNS
jgi:hypothetical protein